VYLLMMNFKKSSLVSLLTKAVIPGHAILLGRQYGRQ